MKTLTDILIISLFCNGWYLITRYGMLLFFLREFYARLANGVIKSDDEVSWMLCHKPILRFFYKPLFGCITCMSSIWGSIIYWSISDSIILWPIAIIGAACGNLLISRILDNLYRD